MTGKTLRVRDTWNVAGVTLNAKQMELAAICDEPDAEEILASGSIRAGKSQVCAKKQVEWAWKYGGKHLCVRKTYKQLEDSTKSIYLGNDGGMPQAIPPELIKQNYRSADMNKVVLLNGAEILFRSCENPGEAMENIRNVTLASVFVDQVEELDTPLEEELYETYLSRLSDPRGPRKLLAAANPGPQSHWVYRRFHPDSPRRQEQTRYVHFTIYDNAHNLPKGYVKRQERRRAKDPMWFKRFCLGEWGAFGGKRFKTWDPDRHLIDPFPIPPAWEAVEGIDYGWHNPTVAELVVVDFDGRYYAVGEFAASETGVRRLAQGIRVMENEAGAAPSDRYLDPSAWATRDEKASIAAQFIDEDVGDLDLGKADNDRLSGWDRIDDMLTTEVPGDPEIARDALDADGKPVLVPRLRIFKGRCPELVDELPNARIKEVRAGAAESEDIEKRNDHALDALRYAINGRPPAPVEDTEDDADPHERYARQRVRRAVDEFEADDDFI